MGESMAEGKPFLPETETAVPIICQPSEGKVVGVLGGRMTFKVFSERPRQVNFFVLPLRLLIGVKCCLLEPYRGGTCHTLPSSMPLPSSA